MSARSTRRHPRPWQFDYLHLRRLLDDLRPVLGQLAAPGGVVLDVFCGSRLGTDFLEHIAPWVRANIGQIPALLGLADAGIARVDVRSVSRVGRGDVGANAARVREFLRRLPEKVTS